MQMSVFALSYRLMRRKNPTNEAKSGEYVARFFPRG
jgi:hypothetical protein